MVTAKPTDHVKDLAEIVPQRREFIRIEKVYGVEDEHYLFQTSHLPPGVMFPVLEIAGAMQDRQGADPKGMLDEAYRLVDIVFRFSEPELPERWVWDRLGTEDVMGIMGDVMGAMGGGGEEGEAPAGADAAVESPPENSVPSSPTSTDGPSTTSSGS